MGILSRIAHLFLFLLTVHQDVSPKTPNAANPIILRPITSFPGTRGANGAVRLLARRNCAWGFPPLSLRLRADSSYVRIFFFVNYFMASIICNNVRC